jgi:hypothetical protein
MRETTETERRQRERETLLDDDSILVALRCRSRQPSSGLSEPPKSPGAIEGRVRSGYRRGKFAASHSSYKFGDSRGFKIFGFLCLNCFAYSAWPLELILRYSKMTTKHRLGVRLGLLQATS